MWQLPVRARSAVLLVVGGLRDGAAGCFNPDPPAPVLLSGDCLRSADALFDSAAEFCCFSVVAAESRGCPDCIVPDPAADFNPALPDKHISRKPKLGL